MRRRDVRSFAGARALGVVLALAATTTASADAQRPSTRVLLEIRPRAGDTLRVRLEQEVEMSGTTRVGGADSTMTVVTRLHAVTHSVVQRADATGATVLAVTDSVRVSATGGHARGEAEQARRMLEGRQVRLRVTPDGAARVLDAVGNGSAELGALFAQMPATLPREPVAVGDTWSRRMPLPGGGGRSAPGALVATFRLDSLTRGGEVAHLSMRGALSQGADAVAAAGGPGGLPPGAKVTVFGQVAGRMAIDRRRGWMTDARTTLTMKSVLVPPAGSEARPLHFRMKLTQRLKAM